VQHINLQVENYLRELLLIYFARQRLILTTAGIIFLVAVAVAFLATPIYSANGAILVRSSEAQRSPEIIGNSDARVFKVSEEDLRSEIELIRSPAVIQGAIDRLVVEMRPTADQFDWLKVQKKLQTEVVPDSRVISVALNLDNAEAAVNLLNAILDEYVLRRSRIIFPEGSTDFFTTQIDRFGRQLDDTEKKLVALANENRTPDPTKEIDQNLLARQELDRRLGLLSTEETALREQINYLTKILSSKDVRHFSSLPNTTISAMAARLIDLQLERGKAARHYEDDSQVVVVIDKQIRSNLEQLHREVEDYREKLASDLTANTEQQRNIREQIKSLEARNLKLYLQRMETDKLNHEAELLRESFATFFKRRQEAEINTRVDSTMSQFYVSILDRAYSTGTPVFPNRPVLLVLGLIAGLMTGFSLGFLREFFDHSFKNPRDLQQYSGLPLLFSIPEIVPNLRTVDVTPGLDHNSHQDPRHKVEKARDKVETTKLSPSPTHPRGPDGPAGGSGLGMEHLTPSPNSTRGHGKPAGVGNVVIKASPPIQTSPRMPPNSMVETSDIKNLAESPRAKPDTLMSTLEQYPTSKSFTQLIGSLLHFRRHQ
jgi:uncharacterized protein involved in exopolysaccharide biosynthesis